MITGLNLWVSLPKSPFMHAFIYPATHAFIDLLINVQFALFDESTSVLCFLCTVSYCPFLGFKKNWAVAETPIELVFFTVIYIIMRHVV